MPPRMDHYKAKATRHIFLIRHSQYHVDASLEKDRTLTPLGTGGGSGPNWPQGRCPCRCSWGRRGPVAGTPGLDASIVTVSNYQPVTPNRRTSGLLQLECPAFIVKTPHGGSRRRWSSKAPMRRGAPMAWKVAGTLCTPLTLTN